MAKRKFNVGDKVVVSDRCPKELLAGIRRNRVRTIKNVFYDPEKQATYYGLGHNFQGPWDEIECRAFRSYMLNPAPRGHKAGRPRQKRKYRRRK